MLAVMVGAGRAFLAVLLLVLIEGVAAGAILIAAGGFGYLVIRKLAPHRSAAALRAVTACALGLWLLSVLMLAAGTAIGGLLKPWLWWPVIGLGVLLAAWQGRNRMEKWRFPTRFDGRFLTWAVIAMAAGVWLAGATNGPALWPGLGHTQQQLQRHLQIPREYYDAQRVGQLRHNCYSYHPLAVEMLFLLAMAMRAGAYEGLYLAKLLHGAFAALAVAGVFGALKDEDHIRGRLAAIMLATCPFVLYLSWLGMVDLAVLCYMTLSVLWLRQWVREEDWRSAFCAALMVGGACAVKYLSFALVAVPVLAMMLVYCAGRARLLWHVGPAILAVAMVVSPWLIRTAAYTGNPIFPLATETLGRGHWSRQSQQRWINAHSVPPDEPVPRPDAWKPAAPPHRLAMFYDRFLAYRSSQWFGPVVMLIAAVAVCALIATTRADPWNWLLVGVTVMQLGAWALVTPRMSGRLIVPAIAPICLLAAWVLSRLAAVQANPLRRRAAHRPHGPWGLAPAVVIAALAAAANLVTAYNIYRLATRDPVTKRPLPPATGVAGRLVAESFWPDRSCRVLAVADSRVFLLPGGSVYATSFDSHVLAEMADRKLSPPQMLQELRSLGITHILVNWPQVWRLASTSGYPASLSAELYDRRQEGQRPGLKVLESLKSVGLRKDEEGGGRGPTTSSAPSSAAATAPAGRQGWRPWNFPPHWPVFTIYSLPWARPAGG